MLTVLGGLAEFERELTVDLLTTIKAIADKGYLFKSMTEPWADTTTPRASQTVQPGHN